MYSLCKNTQWSTSTLYLWIENIRANSFYTLLHQQKPHLIYLQSAIKKEKKNRVCDVNVICNLLTRKPAVVVGVTVVSIKLRGDWSGFTHQQEDKAHSCHFSTWAKSPHCHVQKVNIALTTFLRYVLNKNGTYQKIRRSKTTLPCLFPWLLHALTSIKVAQPSLPKSPNPSYPAPSAPFYLSRSCWPKTSITQPLLNWGHLSFQLISSNSSLSTPTSIFSPPVYLFLPFAK